MHAPPSSASRRRRIIWTSLVLCLASLLTIVAVGAYIEEKSVDNLAGRVVVPVLTPTLSVICRDAITATCAQRAADSSNLPVAWMSAPNGFHLAMFSASHSTASAEALFLADAGGSSQISLHSATRLQRRLTLTGMVAYGSQHATLSQEKVNGAVVEKELRWTHAGGTYALLGVGANLDVSTLIAAWRSVDYATPKVKP